MVMKEAFKDIGYDDVARGLDCRTCNLIIAVYATTPRYRSMSGCQEIEDMGAGDEGIVFGYDAD